jgi:hypothetical protein
VLFRNYYAIMDGKLTELAKITFEETIPYHFFKFVSCRGGNNHSPTRQMRVEFGISELFFKLTRQIGECFFFSS